MATCSVCAKKKPNSYQDMKAIESPPFRASDISVYNTKTDEAKKFVKEDYDVNKINILLFVPSVETIIETGAEIKHEDVVITYVTNQPLHQIKDYYENGGTKPRHDRIFLSYLLPSRTNLVYNGSARKATVYVMKDGDFITQQMFYGSSFNYDSINAFLEDYLHDHN